MTRKNSTGRLGPKAASELHQISSEPSKDEALQRAIALVHDLTIEELEAVVRARGKDKAPEVMRSLEGIRTGAKVEALQRAAAEGRTPTVDELEAAEHEVGLKNDPHMLEELRDMEKITKAANLMIEAYALLRDLQKKGGEMEMEAVQGFLEMAELGIDGLGECSERSTVSVAETKTSWPVMMEGSGTVALETAQADLKKIKLGSRNSSTVRINAVITAATRHKFVATLLYWIVRSNFDLMRLSRTVQDQPIRMARLKQDLKTKSKMLKRLLKGYEANEWREEDRQKLVEKMEELRTCPEVNAASFNAWFGACRALLVCVTKNDFHLPRHNLRDVGQSRAWSAGADKVHDAAADYKEGIVEKMKSALQTVLRIPRKK